jgi:hypothetical protein
MLFLKKIVIPIRRSGVDLIHSPLQKLSLLLGPSNKALGAIHTPGHGPLLLSST